MIKHTRLLFLLLFLRVGGIQAQNTHPPFWDDIQAFKKQDSIHPPPKNAILFVGSSSFTKWTSVQKDFPGYTIINRGFGGSSLPDVIRYQNDVIFPYHPKQVVVDRITHHKKEVQQNLHARRRLQIPARTIFRSDVSPTLNHFGRASQLYDNTHNLLGP